MKKSSIKPFDGLAIMNVSGILRGDIDRISYNSLVKNKKGELYDDNSVLKHIIDTLKAELKKDPLNDNLILKCFFAIEKILYYSENLVESIKLECNSIKSEYEKVCEERNYQNEAINNIIKNLDKVQGTAVASKIKSLDNKLPELEIKKETKETNDKEIKRLTKLLESNQKKLEKKETQLNETKTELKNIRNEKKLLEKENSSLKKEKLNNEKKITTLEENNNNINSLYKLVVDASLDDNKTIDNQKLELEALKEELENYKKIEADNRTNEIIKNEMLEFVITTKIRNNNLINLMMEKYSKTEEEITQLFNQIVYENNLDISVMFNDGIIYRATNIYEPYSNNLSIEIGDNRSLDILFSSDYHITKGNALSNKFDKMLEYCVKENIGLNINLGDTFEFSYYGVNSYIKNKECIHNVAKNFPKDNSVKHLILSGNHDRRMGYLGIDSIRELCKERDDMFYIGNECKTLYFSNQDYIKLLHPGDFPLPTIKNGFVYQYKDSILECINKYYSNENNERNSYIDIVGHFHRGIYNEMDGYYILPSLTYDNVNDGAVHAKIIFNEDKSIKEIIFIPLIFNNGLQPTNEIIYTKHK